MGSLITFPSEISKTDVSVKANEKCVVYTTPDSKTCTLRVSVENNNPKNVCRFSLRDYTIDSEGTTVDMKFIKTKKSFNISDVTHEGNCLRERKGPSRFSILYGVTNRLGILFVQKHKVREKEFYLIIHSCVCHLSSKYSVVAMKVWYDHGNGRLKCKISKGPSWHSSFSEVKEVIMNYLKSKQANTSDIDGNGQQKAITGGGTGSDVINNHGTFNGDLNGSFLEFYDSVFNIYLSK